MIGSSGSDVMLKPAKSSLLCPFCNCVLGEIITELCSSMQDKDGQNCCCIGCRLLDPKKNELDLKVSRLGKVEGERFTVKLKTVWMM